MKLFNYQMTKKDLKLKKILNDAEMIIETNKRKPKASKDRDFKEDIDYISKNFTEAYDYTDVTMHAFIEGDNVDEFWIINDDIWECIITHDGKQYSYLTGGDLNSLEDFKKRYNLP